MSWTKRQIVEEAYGELAIAGHVFDISPEEQEAALRRLDLMMAVWDARGIRLGYPLASSPDDSDLDQDSGLPDSAIEPVYMNLAKRLAAGKGKALTQGTLQAAKDGFDLLLRVAAYPQQQQLPNTLPRGAGSRPWRTGQSPFMPTPTADPIGTTPGGDLDFNGG